MEHITSLRQSFRVDGWPGTKFEIFLFAISFIRVRTDPDKIFIARCE